MYSPQVLKFSQILWKFSNYYKVLKQFLRKFISIIKYAQKHQVFFAIHVNHNEELYGG
jgi:hypothetical protein